jgi:hypothetical protein
LVIGFGDVEDAHEDVVFVGVDLLAALLVGRNRFIFFHVQTGFVRVDRDALKTSIEIARAANVKRRAVVSCQLAEGRLIPVFPAKNL